MTPAVALRDTAGIAKRYLLRTIRMPAEASVLVIQPALILLLFRYVLGGAIKVPGGSYVDFLVPAGMASRARRRIDLARRYLRKRGDVG